MNWDLFIAYPSPERDIAERLARSLEHSLRVFIDTAQIRPGADWDLVIKEAIESSHAIVIVVSPKSDDAYFQREEILIALERARSRSSECIVIPLYVKGIEPSHPSVPYGLRPKQGVVLKDPNDIAAVSDKLAQLVIEAAGEDSESRSFSSSVCKHMEQLNQDIEDLTKEQYRVIQQLRYLRRVRISGCAGSGKTLVAAEKATRLADAGLRVLFICHNPLLAEHVAGLTLGSSVEVYDFISWLHSFNMGFDTVTDVNWSHFDEPNQQELDDALELLSVSNDKFDAIVVDEAQDFRKEWWAIVQSALASEESGRLYIFHDNNQSLLPYRADYPIESPHVDLSRNCRNAGRIFELMKFYDSSAPEAEQKLSSIGAVYLRMCQSGDEREELAGLLSEIQMNIPTGKIVVLWAGNDDLENSPAAGLSVAYAKWSPWQEEVKWQFRNASFSLSLAGLRLPSLEWAWVKQRLEQLSGEPYPTAQDISLVQQVAQAYSIEIDIRQRITRTTPFRYGFHWVLNDNRLALRRRARGRTWGGEVVLHFQRDDWYVGIPEPEKRVVQPYDNPLNEFSIPLYKVSDFKGLEADTVVLLMRGKTINHKQAFYVGISRARATLAVLADEAASGVFPRSFKWDSSL